MTVLIVNRYLNNMHHRNTLKPLENNTHNLKHWSNITSALNNIWTTSQQCGLDIRELSRRPSLRTAQSTMVGGKRAHRNKAQVRVWVLPQVGWSAPPPHTVGGGCLGWQRRGSSTVYKLARCWGALVVCFSVLSSGL